MRGKMPVTKEFRDCLAEFERHKVRYLIIGAYAFGLHAMPRYTKDMDILVDPAAGNVQKANKALADFGSPWLLTAGELTEVVQIGVEPNRIDILQRISGVSFARAWERRIRAPYGDIVANWLGLEDLTRAKKSSDRSRDLEDLAVLEELRRHGSRSSDSTRQKRLDK